MFVVKVSKKIVKWIFVESFAGIGVMMLSALTIERYACVCQLSQYRRPALGPPRLTLIILPLATLLIYLPNVFRAKMMSCIGPDGTLVYQRHDNVLLMKSTFYQVLFMPGR